MEVPAMSLMTTSSYVDDQYGKLSHCGEAMSVVAGSRGYFQPADGYATWRCFCGFQQDGPAAMDLGADEVQLLGIR